MPLPIARPDAVAVPTLARVLITGECIRIIRDGNGAFVARIVEVLREEALDEPTRHEWFPPGEPGKWAHRSLLRVQWFAEVGARAHDARFRTSSINKGKFYRAKQLPELLLTKHTSLVSDKFIEGIVTVFHVGSVQDEEVDVRGMRDVYVIAHEENERGGRHALKKGDWYPFAELDPKNITEAHEPLGLTSLTSRLWRVRLDVRNIITATMIEKHTSATNYGVHTKHMARCSREEWDFIMAAFGDDLYATQNEHRRRVPEASARVSSVGEARTRTADDEVCIIELRSAAALALATEFLGIGWNVGLTRPGRKTLQGAGVVEIADGDLFNAVLVFDENIASKIATPAPRAAPRAAGAAVTAVTDNVDEGGRDGGGGGGCDGDGGRDGGGGGGGDGDDTEGARPQRARAQPDRLTVSTTHGGGRGGGGSRGGGKKRKQPPRPQRLGTVGAVNPTGLRLTFTRFKPETTGELAVQVGWLTETGKKLKEMGELPQPVREPDEEGESDEEDEE